MSDDLLERATRALREESAPSADDLAETRARLLASATTKKVRRTNALRWVLPLAAAFAAGTAFAATNGQLERAVRAVQTWLVEPPQVATATPKPKRKHRVEQPKRVEQAPSLPPPEVAQPVRPTEVPAPEVPAVAEPAAPALAARGVRQKSPAARDRREDGREHVSAEASEPTPTPDETKSVEAPVADTAVERTKPQPAPSADLALYREAHRTHFVAREYADALSLWNGYLARFPAGIFVLEARYNRAICLVRLGRKQEATEALRPFAEGEVKGAYRRDEARALLDALNKKP